MSSLHIAIPTPSFCSFWHGHPYIPIHFLKMFFILVYKVLLHCVIVDVSVPALFIHEIHSSVFVVLIYTAGYQGGGRLSM